MNILKRKWLQLRRRIRWALGKGWDATDFSGRYESPEKDSWSYTTDPAHLERLHRILEALSPLSGKRVLELGCAEGFITKEIAKQAAQVVACELSPVAAERARIACVGLPVSVFECDIRTNLPNATFDSILASDVFYYLTQDEITDVIRSLTQRGNPDCKLLLANEWNSSYSLLSSPKKIIDTIQRDGHWQLEEHHVINAQTSSHTIAIFRLQIASGKASPS